MSETETNIITLYPKDINLKSHFMGTEFENIEAERVVRNIVVGQLKTNPEAWTPFSFKDYKKNCSHNVTNDEAGVLEALVNGGKPVWNTTARLEKGYLTKKGNKYSVTPKLLGVLEEFTFNPVKKVKKPVELIDAKEINLFFKRKGYYECIVTTKDEIEDPYDRKITAEIVKAKKWTKGTYVGSMGSCSADNLNSYTDDNYFYINAKDWQYNKDYDVYMAIPKTLLDNKEHYTENFSKSIDRSSCITYLFV